MGISGIFHCHGTCIAINGQGVLLRGAPGSGKSDLALRLIDTVGPGFSGHPRNCQLVADDQVILQRQNDSLICSGPEALGGLLEIRGFGLVKLDYCPTVPLALVVDLVAMSQIERLPEPAFFTLFDCKIPLFQLDPTRAGATSKLFALMELQDRLVSG